MTTQPITIVQTFYISTGALNAMHTLRMTRDVFGGPSLGNFRPDHYIRNLAVDVEEAQRKAQEYFDAWKDRVGGEREDFKLVLDLDPEYEIGKRRGKLSARDTMALNDIEAGISPFGKHKGIPLIDLPDSYVLFFADQVRDDEANVVMAAFKAACLGVALEKGLIAKRDAARAARAEADALSQHVGTVGERREFTGEIVTSIFKRWFEYGPADHGYWIVKVRVGNDLISYMGSAALGERGDTVTFRATIKGHSEYKGVKETKVNRPTNIKREED